MSKNNTLAVYIGRFQPFHFGHAKVLTQAVESGYNNILVLIGSANKARDIKNPLTVYEREEIIRNWWWIPAHCAPDAAALSIRYIRDYPYNDTKWIQQVQSNVSEVAASLDLTDIVLLGSDRDESTWYLRSFPQWKTELSEPVCIKGAPVGNLSATYLRDLLFTTESRTLILPEVPDVTNKFIASFIKTPTYESLRKEYEFIAKYKSAWKTAPYPPTFVTVDACVCQSGHVLVIERRASPGAGLWALPGGFVNQNERLQDAVIRELIEETKIKVTPNILKGSMCAREIFDNPNRSLRGRTISTAYLFRLDDTKKLPTVKGSDDAVKAFWLPINEALLKPHMWFEDHFDILETMINKA